MHATLREGARGKGRRGEEGESALLVELVEDRGEQGRDHLEGVQRSAARAGGGDDERARGVTRRHADDLAGQARQGSVREVVGVTARDSSGALIISSPGSRGGALDTLEVVTPLLPAIFHQLDEQR